MVESPDAVNDKIQERVEIDQSRRIHAISMKMVKLRNPEGLRMYDKDMSLIVDITWDWTTDYVGNWTEPQVIPIGQ